MTAGEMTEMRAAPPTPEECQHPAPVIGVMAHEFSPYRGAVGPEGKRRTTMYYGPVIGALPISAWHCEVCGLLRLTYYDGRKEERRLYPGPQPGLIAAAVADEAAPATSRGVQARVSGLTLPVELERALIPERAPLSISLPRPDLPDLGVTIWLVVLLLGAGAVELLILGYGAVHDWRTASWVGPLAAVTGATFGAAALLVVLGPVAGRVFPMPKLGPSPAVVHRGAPVMDGAARTVVTLLVVVMLGLALAGILAIYDWRTPGILGPVVAVLAVTFGVAVVVALAGYVSRRLARPR